MTDTMNQFVGMARGDDVFPGLADRYRPIIKAIYDNLPVGEPTRFSNARLAEVIGGTNARLLARYVDRLVQFGMLKREIVRPKTGEGFASGVAAMWTVLMPREEGEALADTIAKDSTERVIAGRKKGPGARVAKVPKTTYLTNGHSAAEWLAEVRAYSNRAGSMAKRVDDLAQMAAEAGVNFDRDKAMEAFRFDAVQDERLEGGALLLPVIDALLAQVPSSVRAQYMESH